MHRRGRLPSFLLAFVVAAAWPLSTCTAAPASTGASAPDSISTTRPDSVSTARPDSVSAARPDSVGAAPRDSVRTAAPDSIPSARPDSISTAPPDSAAAGGKLVPKQAVLPDTLEFLPPPGSRTGSGPKTGGAAGTPAPPKERVGLFGLHPIMILIGLAALHYFIIKAVSH